MTWVTRWYESDSRFISAHYQPAILIDLARSRDVDTHRLLRGTRLFYDDILCGKTIITPQQFLLLIDNAKRLIGSDDTSFLYGQRLLPGHYGAVSHALRHASHLQQALEHLVTYRALLSPLLVPRLFQDEHATYLYWLDACGAGQQNTFLVEASMTAVSAMVRWLAGERFPWQFQFRHAQPRHIEQYWAHLGESVQFDRHINAMIIPREYLFKEWPGAAVTASVVAQQESSSQLAGLDFDASLLDRLYAYLQANLRHHVKLDGVALAFGMSPATLKRKLQKHDTHFQEQVDLVRMHAALYYYQVKGYSNEEVADILNFQDVTNLRRSFKRWTGLSPSAVKTLLSSDT